MTQAMKNTQKIAVFAFATALVGTTIYLLRKRQHSKRRDFVANAGYEMAYDVHFPMKYKKARRTPEGNKGEI
jgi:hypothetical protein